MTFDYGRMNNTNFEYYKQGKLPNLEENKPMAFQVSLGVLVQERDLTRIIPLVSTSIGVFACGEFRKGPLDEIVTISSEPELVDTFGKLDSNNFEHFFAANFLQYSNSLRVVQLLPKHHTLMLTTLPSFLIKNLDDYDANYVGGEIFEKSANYVAKTAYVHGNNLLVSTCPSVTAYSQTLQRNSVNGAVVSATQP